MTFSSEGHFNVFSNKINLWLGISVNSSYPIELQVANTQSQLFLPAQASQMSNLSNCAPQSQYLQLQVQGTSSSQVALSQLSFAPAADTQTALREQTSEKCFVKGNPVDNNEVSLESLKRLFVADESCVSQSGDEEVGSVGMRTKKPKLEIKFEDPNLEVCLSQNVSVSKPSNNVTGSSTSNYPIKVEDCEHKMRRFENNYNSSSCTCGQSSQNYLDVQNLPKQFGPTPFPCIPQLTKPAFDIKQENDAPFSANTSSASIFDSSYLRSDHTCNTSAIYHDSLESFDPPTITQSDIARALQEYSSNQRDKQRRIPAMDPIEDALVSTITHIANREKNSVLDLSDEELCLKIARRLNSSSFSKVLRRIESIIVPSYELEYQQ